MARLNNVMDHQDFYCHLIQASGLLAAQITFPKSQWYFVADHSPGG